MAFTLKLFFKKIWVQGAENIPEGPIIFAVNHQNSFLDALLVTVTTDRDPYYLARGDVFKNNLATRLLNFINILPIYRSTDGVTNLKKNEAMFDSCVAKLREGKAVLIFPEAYHKYVYQLRPIRKGIARLAMIAHEAGLKNIQIVPVGIQYENYFNAGYPVVVSYGQPIPVSNYASLYAKDSQQAFKEICGATAMGMKPLIVDIPVSDYDQLLEKWQASRQLQENAILQLAADQQLVAKIESNPSDYIDKNIRQASSRWYLWPFFAWSTIVFVVPYLLQYWLNRATKDTQYIASMKVASWYFFVPEIMLIEGAIIYLFTHSLPVLFSFLALSILCGWITIKRYFPL